MTKPKVRQVVLDTETTGLNPQEGHRIIEIGCVELVNRRLTQNRFHVYINPDRVIDQGAIEVHGITNEFLEDKPRFEAIVEDFIAFIRGAELIIHNAPFDVGFINHEFALLNNGTGSVVDYSEVFDTLTYARQKHPGQRNSLDALCKRYGIDNSHRDLHGALLDAEILADVFLIMTGGQFSLLDEGLSEQEAVSTNTVYSVLPADRPALKVIRCNEEELRAHQQRLEAVEKASGACIWNQLV
ncbi:MAG: DNA polymerase III subunit epsilon [Methylobacter sp.]|jgi:DNA polymerase III subunit epsilon|uniref:DNA polymerase III subunit epsilon n=1 Tax=unclassified Methylobacter TaxID=2635283 RepID=UPI000562FD9E|nr:MULTISPECIES: DNA polymerase III subunit epsilon [unclassified Methylobacter]MCL7420481.1 DNA polymerase III subunit epsilon [Methylobacter sp.]